MQRVYLDQNAWVRLARAHFGRDDDMPTVAALNATRQALRLGLASFPLSWIHYFETYRKRDPAARRRLGQFMAEISDFHSMRGAGALLEQEVLAALARVQGLPEPAEPQVFGRGHAHAFGKEHADLTQEPYRTLVAREGGEVVRNMIELEMLRGPDVALPHGDIQAPQHVGSQRQLELEREVEETLAVHGRGGDMANRIVLTQEALDLTEYIPAALLPDGNTNSGIPKSRKFLTDLLLSMPAKGTITRMRMTAHQNSQFTWAIGDLNDMMALGTAAAYCDVVVAEKKWGDVLQRHSKSLRATVITDVAGLPEALAAAATR